MVLGYMYLSLRHADVNVIALADGGESGRAAQRPGFFFFLMVGIANAHGPIAARCPPIRTPLQFGSAIGWGKGVKALV